MSTLLKPTTLSLDLSRFVPHRFDVLGEMLSACKIHRKPPLLPIEFDLHTHKLSFANFERDRPIVSALYARTFESVFAHGAESLSYNGLRWGRYEMMLVSLVP